MKRQQYFPGITLLALVTAVYALPTAKITIKVVDELGNPIQNAEAGINFEAPKAVGEGGGANIKRVNGKTDADGLFAAEEETASFVSFSAKHDDFYESSGYFKKFSSVGGFIGIRKYEPWNPTVELVLKKKINPIPMYAVNWAAPLPGELPELPVIGQFAGYDLIANDWVAPHGLGVNSDFLFKVEMKHGKSYDDHDVSLTVKFSNPGDGLIEFTPKSSRGKSALRMPHNAPASGYKEQWVQRYQRSPGVPVVGKRGYPDYENNFFFRVRTELDDKGNAIGGLYGKIHGPIKLSNYVGEGSSNPTISLNYYLNPNNNDKNVEFDLERNLFRGVPPRKKVTAP